MKILSLLLLTLPFLAQAQISYVVTKQTALSAAAEVITVQQPTTASKQVNFKTAYIDCSVACGLTIERNGTPATTTTLAVGNVNLNETAASSKAFSSSNIGTGTVLATLSIPAGGSIVIDLSTIQFLQGADQGKNLTLRTSSITGTVNIIIGLTEQTR